MPEKAREHPAQVLQVLSDGKWHRLNEIAEKLRLRQERVQEIVRFFSKYGLAEFDERKRVVKLTPPMLEFSRRASRPISPRAFPNQ